MTEWQGLLDLGRVLMEFIQLHSTAFRFSVCLLLAHWITYAYCIKGEPVSDDIDGIMRYDGKLQKTEGYGGLFRWIRFKLCGRNMKAHHVMSLLVQSANLVLVYLFLAKLFNPTFSFLATLLWAMHPAGTQCIAWISGLGYILGVFWGFLLLNLVSFFNPVTLIASLAFLPLFVPLYALAVYAQFEMLALFIILLYLKYYYLAGVGLVLSVILGLQIVKKTIDFRSNAFKEQNMGYPTMLHWQKLIVAFKTFQYYIRLAVFPKHLGLYHTFHFHYDKGAEVVDKYAFVGLLLAIVSAICIYYGSPPIQFGLIWFIALIWVLLNWVTIQQFVADRYLYIPILGFCVIGAYFLQPFPFAYWLIVGFLAMRTMIHLPTFNNELQFYQSNVWNFPASEVAITNLGVICMRCGLPNMAIDYWKVALRVNPNYDVPAYNLYSALRSNGIVGEARDYLVKAVSSSLCHFREKWTEELKEFDKAEEEKCKNLPQKSSTMNLPVNSSELPLEIGKILIVSGGPTAQPLAATTTS